MGVYQSREAIQRPLGRFGTQSTSLPSLAGLLGCLPIKKDTPLTEDVFTDAGWSVRNYAGICNWINRVQTVSFIFKQFPLQELSRIFRQCLHLFLPKPNQWIACKSFKGTRPAQIQQLERANHLLSRKASKRSNKHQLCLVLGAVSVVFGVLKHPGSSFASPLCSSSTRPPHPQWKP